MLIRQGAIVLLYCIFLTGCSPKPVSIDSAPASNASKTLASEPFVNATAERGPEGETYISGSTNLPEGMKMWLTVGSSASPDDEGVFVRRGKFRSAALYAESPNPDLRAAKAKRPAGDSIRVLKSPFPAGIHKVSFTAFFNGAWQDESVLLLTGEGGKNLRGKIFKATDSDVTDSDKTLDARLNLSFPPISDTAQAIQLVKRARLTVPGSGRSATDIDTNIELFMNSGNGLHPLSGWSAKPDAAGGYEVRYEFVNGALGNEAALWSTNLKTKQVKYVNSSGKILSWTSN